MTEAKLVAVAVEDELGLDGEVSAHFGRCRGYLMVHIENGGIGKVEGLKNPFFQAHEPGVVPRFIKDAGADVILAGGMGPRAVDMFKGFGIEVVTGGVGNVRKVLEAWLRGELRGIVPCHHDHPESCGGHGEGAHS
jgi:predicted Fe-Mo cluster-binding NifX family protein